MTTFHNLLIIMLAIVVVASRTCSSTYPQICFKFCANQSSATFGPPCPEDVDSNDQICDVGFVQALITSSVSIYGFRLLFSCVHPPSSTGGDGPLSKCCMEACANLQGTLPINACSLFSDVLLQVSDDPDSNRSDFVLDAYDGTEAVLASLLS